MGIGYAIRSGADTVTPIVTIRETAAVGASLEASDVRDLSHIRRLLLQAAFSVSGPEGKTEDHPMPVVKLTLLRSFLAAQGCGDKARARTLLLLALLQLEDEDDVQRFVMPHAILPAALPSR